MSGGRLTTHVLDVSRGQPAAGVKVQLWRLDGGGLPGVLVTEAETNADGRLDRPLLADGRLERGVYELLFHIGGYFGRFDNDGGTGGRTDGANSGHTDGANSGHTDVVNSGHTDGANSGHTDGVNSRRTEGGTGGQKERDSNTAGAGASVPEQLLEQVPVRFRITDPEAHYHIPLLAAPGGYSTYRGS